MPKKKHPTLPVGTENGFSCSIPIRQAYGTGHKVENAKDVKSKPVGIC